MQEKNQKKIKASGTPAKFAGYIKRSKRKSRGSFLLPFPLRTRGEKAICDGLIFFCLFSCIKERKEGVRRKKYPFLTTSNQKIMTEERVIEVEKLTKRFGDFTAVDEISFQVRRGEIFGFLGANGAGKTTAMRMLCGLLSPTAGRAEVAGFDVYREADRIKHHIGYMSQRFSLYEDLTVAENIRLFGGIYGLTKRAIRERGEELISRLELQEEAHHRVGSLPLGWKQKLAFSVAVIHRPRIVFLDEPTGGVDPITRRRFWDLIIQAADAGITVFVTTHYMDEAEYCDRVSMMVDGRIEALDSPEALKRQFEASTMDEVFLQLARKATRGDD